jgi:hypothetical protein
MPARGYEAMINLKRTVRGSFGVLSLSAALVLAQPAQASEPAPSGLVLGTIDALLGYCGSLDPTMAARYQERTKVFVQGVDEEAVAEVRKSDEYKQAYDSTVELFRGVDEESTRRTCSQSLAANQ